MIVILSHVTAQTTCGAVKTLYQSGSCCGADASVAVDVSIKLDAQTRYFDAANFALTTLGVTNFIFTPQALGAPVAPPAGVIGTYDGLNKDPVTLAPTKYDRIVIPSDGNAYFQAGAQGTIPLTRISLHRFSLRSRTGIRCS